MAGIIEKFDGEIYVFDSSHKDRADAGKRANVLKEEGKSVRVIRSSQSWLVYVRR